MYISNFGLGQNTILIAQCRNKYWWCGGCDVALMSSLLVYWPFSASARYSSLGVCFCHKCAFIPACIIVGTCAGAHPCLRNVCKMSLYMCRNSD